LEKCRWRIALKAAAFQDIRAILYFASIMCNFLPASLPVTPPELYGGHRQTDRQTDRQKKWSDKAYKAKSQLVHRHKNQPPMSANLKDLYK